LSTPLRISLVTLALALCACTEEQSRAIGQQPKKTLDRVTTDLDKATQQQSDRLKEGEK
jgi:hypothetical protein